MHAPVQLKPVPSSDSPVITFPPPTAQRWTLPNGLTLIVQEDRSAPVASVQAWCGTGSVDEDAQLGAGLSHILEHMLFKGTKTRGANAIAQAVQDVGGYINAYTSFDRTVYWIDVPKAGVSTALDILADAVMNSTCRRRNTPRNRKSSGASSRWGLMIPIAWRGNYSSPPPISGIRIVCRSSVCSTFSTSSRRRT